jgi:hypothetical protein
MPKHPNAYGGLSRFLIAYLALLLGVLMLVHLLQPDREGLARSSRSASASGGAGHPEAGGDAKLRRQA